MVSFNMNYAVPYMTYQMMPMVMPSMAFAGMGVASGMVGMPFLGGMGIQQAGGIGMGLGAVGMPLAGGLGVQQAGGITMGLGGARVGLDTSALAAALGLGTSPGLSMSATATMETQLLRALLARSLGVTAPGAAQGAAAADTDPEARLQRLGTRLDELNRRISDGLSALEQMRSDMNDGMRGMAELKAQLAEVRKRLEGIEKGRKPE
jgi:hypothetical protein